MTTSGITDWSLTVLQVCTEAAKEIGVIEAGAELEADELEDCMLRLNMVIKSQAVKGNLYREATGTVTVPAGSGSGTLDADIRDISAVRYVVGTNNERPLAYWNRGRYFQVPNRAASGAPTTYYVEKGVSGVTLYVWPVPTEEATLKVDYSRAPEIATDGAQTLDIPQDWQPWLIKRLAVEIANMFGAARTDVTTLQKVKAEADALETMLMDADRPDTYVFEPYDGSYY